MLARRVLFTAFVLSLSALPAWRAAADPVAIGGEFLVNGTTSGSQEAPQIATSSTGALVAVWHGPESGAGQGIYGRLYNSSGSATTSEFSINTTTTGNQGQPDVACKQNGDFVVVWQGPDANGNGIYARKYSANGTAAGGEIAINSTTSGEQVKPVVAYAESGKFLVLWQSSGQDGSGDGIYGRLFGSNGSALTSELLINTTTSGNQQDPALVATRVPAEGYVAVWEGPDSSGVGIYLQRIEDDGDLAGGETLVNSGNGNTSGDQLNPAVAASSLSPDTSGLNRLAVVWQSSNGTAQRIWYRLFTTSGSVDSAVTEVDDDDSYSGDQTDPDVSMGDGTPEGFAELMTTWTQTADVRQVHGQNLYIVCARRPRASAFAGDSWRVPDNPEIEVSVSGTQTGLSGVAVEPNLDFAVIWQSDGQDGSGQGVYARRFDANLSSLFDSGFEDGTTDLWSRTTP